MEGGIYSTIRIPPSKFIVLPFKILLTIEIKKSRTLRGIRLFYFLFVVVPRIGLGYQKWT